MPTPAIFVNYAQRLAPFRTMPGKTRFAIAAVLALLPAVLERQRVNGTNRA
jgi:hypothetical protein